MNKSFMLVSLFGLLLYSNLKSQANIVFKCVILIVID